MLVRRNLPWGGVLKAPHKVLLFASFVQLPVLCAQNCSGVSGCSSAYGCSGAYAYSGAYGYSYG